MVVDFWAKGWVKFPFDPALAEWVGQVLPAAQQSVTAPEHAE
ncbi:hypothetical protein [Ruegeria sp.]